MTDIRILEWNINQRSRENCTFPSYVIEEISHKDPDVIVLVEFKGLDNKSRLDSSFSESYYTYSYNEKNTNKRGNGIYIALKKSKFEIPLKEDVTYEDCSITTQPDWLRINCTLKTGDKITIIGTRIKVGGETTRKKELGSRRNQIKWLLTENKDFSKQIIIGDLNYGPSETDWDEHLKLNWQDIIYAMREKGYLNCNQYSPYSPSGYSWKSKNLDWLITKGVQVNLKSNYNQLDWSFGKNNTFPYIEGYLTADGLFICSKPPFPDHAIFTAEISI